MFKYKGYRVDFFHSDHTSLPCEPWNRRTICVIVPEVSAPDVLIPAMAHGEALCSKKDQFSRIKGREIAFQRALAAFTGDKKERREWWLAFWNSDDGRRTDGSIALRKRLALL